MDRISWIRTAEDASRSNNTQVRDWDKDLVWCADHHHITLLQAQALEAET